MNVPPRVATSGWHLAWRAETAFPIVTATPTSCRFLAKLSSAGTRLQAEFSGQANPRGYTILGASVALPTGPTSLTVAPGSSIPLTFGGKPGVTVGPGARIVSDSVPFVTVDNGPVLVTVSASAGDAYGKGELSEPGGCSASSVVPSAAAAPASAFAARPGYVRWLRSLLVDGPPQRSTAVLGDSITEGPGPQVMGNYPRWTDVLTVGGSDVVNAGVGGNALTRTGMFGTASGESRATALLAEPNLTDLVICLGTNDLVFGASGQQVLDSIDRVVAKARSLGVRTWVCTIAPRYREGWTAYGENQRLLINNSVRGAWLKSRGASVIDVDAALRNPSIPHSMQAAYDSGDHIHPNVLGSYVIGLTALHAMNLPPARPAGPAPTPSATSPSPTSVPSSTLSQLAQLAQLRLVL